MAGYRFQNLTINDQKYFLSDDAKDVQTATAACSQLLASLATFDNNAEFQQLVESLPRYLNSVLLPLSVWISVTWSDTNHVYSWKSEVLPDRSWISGEPNLNCWWQHGGICCPAMDWSGKYNGLKLRDCRDGYRFLCRSDLVNECASQPGVCSHTCIDKTVGFECACSPGYFLASDNSTCRDVDECALNICSRNCSSAVGNLACSCTNTIGSFACGCNAGFTFSVDGFGCEDVDECSSPANTCQHDCSNTNGSFHCTCHRGYVLDTHGVCQDVNECESHNGHCQQTCSNLGGSYKCSCIPGFVLSNDNTSCGDINECVTNTHQCEHVCANNRGGYNCSCKSGYVLQRDNHSCVDIDECSAHPKPCMHSCDNINGSYMCSCKEGFELLPDNTSCSDVDECRVYSDACQHIWVTAADELTCTFNPEHTIYVDTRPCTDLHTCATTLPVCSTPCENTVGGYKCACPHGFESNGSICIDIDECADSVKPCSHECLNSFGSYSCNCPPGLRISQTKASECVDIDECLEHKDACEQDCVNTEGSYQCACFHGYQINSTDTTSCQDVDECSQSNSSCMHICFNSPGSFSCLCYTGFELGPDNASCEEAHAVYQCPCWCVRSKYSHKHSFAALNEDTHHVQHYLSVNYRSLSTTERRKTSAGDHRISSYVAGAMAFGIVAIPFGVIIVADIFRLVYGAVQNFLLAIATLTRPQSLLIQA